MVNFFFEDIEILDLDPEFFVSWLSNVCLEEGKELEEVNLIFCSDDYLLKMNNDFLEHDYYTDIITFDYCVDNQIMGDLFISKDRVEENAITNSVTFLNELYRVCVHGVLHLCGYKDKSPTESTLMREKENFYLDKIVPRETI